MYSTRPAQLSDYEFLFELKKAAEFEPIKAVFGWDESMQRDIHHSEWSQAKPTIIEVDGRSVGSYLVQKHDTHWDFGRFFLLPEAQGKGVGTKILRLILDQADNANMPVQLCYLQGNRVGQLYRRLGFTVISEDAQFVHMRR
ncbi:GNAT family N-acetyltransferase [Vibrio tubiashii]|uniref:GNAT family N-acetyltransferase n=1 Tax=Vibrio tubiashii TaxID=29498 RepID=UPI001EFD93B0|nr:GNAT family N-acetyltransferase [Vibrio tubiashii]MCG9577083.1 GNAT family N-acetyltransferase [Vibrio tubiashii]